MDSPRLALVTNSRKGVDRAGPRWMTWGLGTLLLSAAAISTFSGADEARRRFDPLPLASSTLQQALDLGSKDEQVRGKLVEIRAMVARRPLDTRTRVIFAGLLLSLSSSVQELQASVFHARLAAELSPVTVPVVRVSALVLAHAGKVGEAAVLVRRMFVYDPRSAADLLGQIEHQLSAIQKREAVPADPDSWFAWSDVLLNRGRVEDSEAVLEEAIRRWPDHLPTLERVAGAAAKKKDWDALARLFPSGQALPETPESAVSIAYRALSNGKAGDTAATRRDIQTALRLGGDTVGPRKVCGDASLAIGDHAEARRLWNEVLFRLHPQQGGLRLSILVRLARLEQRHGDPAAALRHWRSVLELSPENVEARRRIDELTGAAY